MEMSTPGEVVRATSTTHEQQSSMPAARSVGSIDTGTEAEEDEGGDSGWRASRGPRKRVRTCCQVEVQDEPNGSGSSLESSRTSAHVKERCYQIYDAENAHYNAYLEE